MHALSPDEQAFLRPILEQHAAVEASMDMETFVSLMTAAMNESTTGPLTALASSRSSARFTQRRVTWTRRASRTLSILTTCRAIPSEWPRSSSSDATWATANGSSDGSTYQMSVPCGAREGKHSRGSRKPKRWLNVPSHLKSTRERLRKGVLES